MLLSLQRFTVYRKLPMMVGRHERTLAIDGDYIHVCDTNPSFLPTPLSKFSLSDHASGEQRVARQREDFFISHQERRLLQAKQEISELDGCEAHFLARWREQDIRL